MSASEVYKVNANDRFGPIWKLTKLTPMAVLMAGCGPSADGVREANAAADAIPAGIYSNVEYIEEAGDLLGMELSLPQGSETGTAEFTNCEGTCGRIDRVAIRRGLNGVFFEIPDYGGKPVLIAVEKSGAGVNLNVGWETGMRTYHLAKVEREWGLRVARGL